MDEMGLNKLICQVFKNMQIKLIRLIDHISTLCPYHPLKILRTLDVCLELSFSKDGFQP